MTTGETERPVVLIVDDDRNTREGLDRALCRTYRVLTAESGESALALLGANEVDVLLSDLRMPGMDGLTLLQRALARDPALVCILLTAYGNVEAAVEAMKKGAYDFLTKPVNLDHLELLLDRAVRSRRMESENTNLHEQLDRKYGMENIIGDSPAMQEVFDVIRQAAPTHATVLVEGESGTGKELVAHAIHRLSPRSKGPFVAVHCAALAPNLLESELLGHEKGAFTGAVARRRGRFELADGGTLFLDEVSEIDASIQVKLLRVLEEQRFERVGGSETLQVDVRIIAATNRNLRSLAEKGRFRGDLFFRLAVVDITIPPLRDRIEDVPLLCAHFLRQAAVESGKNVDGFSPDAMRLLTSYAWPGNVREVRNTIQKMVVLARGTKLAARDVPLTIREAARPGGSAASVGSASPPDPTDGSLADAERKLIVSCLARHGNNRTKAALALGISRRTLHRKLNRYKVDGQDTVDGQDAPAGPSAQGDTPVV